MLNDDDEVIRELDVVVCPYANLFLAQFPLKPVFADPLTIQSARYKPDNRQMELKVPLYKPPGSDSHGDLDAQRYASTEVNPTNSLGAAFISNNTMYISPLEGIFQLRPNLKQFYDTKTENVEYSMDMEEDEDGDKEAPGPSAAGAGNMQQVQLKRKESERAQSARLQSFAHIKQQQELEAWRLLKVHPIGSKEADGKFVEIAASADVINLV